jgi:hypothetical protein
VTSRGGTSYGARSPWKRLCAGQDNLCKRTECRQVISV